VVHLGSAVADLDGLLRVARRHGIPLIEDCAQAHGARYGDQHVGTFGVAGTFSMQHSKLLTSGEGGAVITNDDALARRLEHLRADGRSLRTEPPPIDQMELRETAEVMGSNYCLSEFHSAILLAQLEKLDAENALRRCNAEYLDDLLRQLECEPQATAEGTTSRAYYCYVAALPDEVLEHTSAQRIAEALSAELGLPCKPMYASLNANRLYRPETRRRFAIDADFAEAVKPQRFELPAAVEFARRSIALPHRCLLAEPSDMLDVQRAMEKVLVHAHQL
jgi:L-glutamine:2-deoxy-scyllo-inosose/3-amino-2,3-dideoxy-scyllo-inosose aminotransferase